jgi:segregation and condensation protein B
MSSLKLIIEGLIFVSDSPLSFGKLCDILSEYNKEDIRSAISELHQDYNPSERGIFLAEVAEGYQFRTCKENAEFVRRLIRNNSSKLSKPALETLSIVAYRQPITRAEVEYLRGVESGGVLKTLLEKNLLKILGKKNIPGKPLIYGTSKKFLEIFNLSDLKSLPTLKEIQALEETSIFEHQAELPLGDSKEKSLDADLSDVSGKDDLHTRGDHI